MLWVALLLGLVEGITEFLPISSTGHLILASELVSFHGKRAEVFQISIQLGAILAVVWEFRARIFVLVRDLPTKIESRAFAFNLGLAFVPLAAIGLLIHDFTTRYLYKPVPIALALIVGGLLIFVVEGMDLKARTQTAETTSWQQAATIGFAQCLALWPGFSRSAATILGGMGAGLTRSAATEFSFFLAIPTMFAATGYDLLKNYDELLPGDWTWLGLAFVIAFFVAWASIRWLLRFVSNHSFRAFAWYRLALGAVILGWAYFRLP
jgi:undecaprenyl-diphosphatase